MCIYIHMSEYIHIHICIDVELCETKIGLGKRIKDWYLNLKLQEP